MTQYNVLGELSVCILSVILIFNVLGSSSLKGRAHKLFVANCILLFLSTSTNCLSIYCIMHWQNLNLALCTVVTSIFFMMLFASPFMLSLYGYYFMSQRKKHIKLAMTCLLLPLLFSYIVLIFNSRYGLIFKYDSTRGYVRGPLKNITYATTFLYAVFLLFNVYTNRRMLSRRLKEVFVLYPVVSLCISMIQFANPGWVMTGTAAIATILLLYITIQADIMDYDLTTGLPTERHLKKIFENYTRTTYKLCVIHIENFNEIAENMNQAIVSNFMTVTAKHLMNCFGSHTYLLGRDKFLVLSRHEEQIETEVPAVCETMNNHNSVEGINIKAETKCVMLTVPQDASTFSQALTIVSKLLSDGVRGKKYDIIKCDSNYTSKIERENKIYEILQRELTVESKDYQVYYQPIYDVKEQRFKYCECLSRLYDKDLGNISPAEFVPIAEKKGLIEKLGNVAFEKICKFMSQNPGVIPAVTVNFSVFQLMNPDIVDNVLSMMKKYNLSSDRIIIEITESIIIDNFEVIQERMTRFSQNGLVFYLDDFGTGYSNFANVVNLPFKTIKFDRSSMLMMEESNKVKHFFTSLIQFFLSQGLNTVVEGVETDEQDAMVKSTGANYIQGFRYSKPLPESEVLSVFKA